MTPVLPRSGSDLPNWSIKVLEPDGACVPPLDA